MKDQSKLSPRLRAALNSFINWFEDNMGDETFVHIDNKGKEKHISYLELPEYQILLEILHEIYPK